MALPACQPSPGVMEVGGWNDDSVLGAEPQGSGKPHHHPIAPQRRPTNPPATKVAEMSRGAPCVCTDLPTTVALTGVSLGVAVDLGGTLGDLDLVDLGLEVERLGRVELAARLAVADDGVVVRVVGELVRDGTWCQH